MVFEAMKKVLENRSEQKKKRVEEMALIALEVIARL